MTNNTIHNQSSPEQEEETDYHDDRKKKHFLHAAEENKRLKIMCKSRINTVLFLLENDVSINSVDCRTRTACHHATELGRRETCTKLTSLDGASLTIVDVDGKTTLEVASNAGHDELSTLLESCRV